MLLFSGFISGAVHTEDIKKVSIEKAETILLLAHYTIKERSDAITAMNGLLARNINPKARIAAELLAPTSREYLEIAGANFIIGVSEIGGILIADACVGKNTMVETITSSKN